MFKNSYAIILWTTDSIQEAENIAAELLEKKLIACANITPKVISLFHWEGKLERADECKVFMKSKEENFSAVEKYIQKNSSYDVPEILLLSIKKGHGPYLAFIDEALK